MNLKSGLCQDSSAKLLFAVVLFSSTSLLAHLVHDSLAMWGSAVVGGKCLRSSQRKVFIKCVGFFFFFLPCWALPWAHENEWLTSCSSHPARSGEAESFPTVTWGGRACAARKAPRNLWQWKLGGVFFFLQVLNALRKLYCKTGCKSC